MKYSVSAARRKTYLQIEQNKIKFKLAIQIGFIYLIIFSTYNTKSA